MKTKISYLEFARPFKHNNDFFVLCHKVLKIYATENNIKYTNSVKEKCYNFENASDLLKIRFAFLEICHASMWCPIVFPLP